MFKLLALMSVLILFTACSSRKEDEKVAETKNVDRQLIVTPMSETEISNIILTADSEEMNLSDIGRKKATNSQVKEFAKKMFREHEMHNSRMSAMAENKGVMLVETKTSMEMKFSSQEEIEKLKKLKGNTFDKTFMEAQIKLHEDLLQELENSLIPNALDAELNAFLQDTRSTVEGHLQEAKEILASL